jgi:glycosyltransferase involved in cell wall biosynthesis
MGVPQEKIRVIHNGGGEGFSRADDGAVDKLLGESGIGRGYYLFVGSDRPHKNLEAVAETLNLLSGDESFVIAGRVRDEAKALFAQFGERVKFINRNLDKDEMAALYSGASALLFPSFHEGFGLPPLEAMACGTPVVASNASCMPEVLGDSAIMADPRDYRAMAEGLMRLKNDAGLRAGYISKGRERLRKFSWEQAARMTLEVYGETA